MRGLDLVLIAALTLAACTLVDRGARVDVEPEGGEGEGAARLDPAGEGEGDVVGEGEGDVLGEGEGEGDVVGEGEGEGEGEGDVLGEGEGEGDIAEGEGEMEAPAFFFAVGYGGRRLTSLDGHVWQNDHSDVAHGGDDDDLLRDACFGHGVYLAVGGSRVGRMLTTTDGVDYSQFTDDRGWLGGCAFGNGMFVAVGSDRSIRSLDDGVTWTDPTTQRVGGLNWQARDLAFGAGRFVAAGDHGLSTSIDGVAWSTPTGPSMEHVAFGRGIWIALGDGSRGRSTDGVHWTFEGGGGRDVVFDGERFVSVGGFGVQTSSDGVAWQQQPGPGQELVAYGRGVYVGATWSNRRRASNDLVGWSEVGSDDGNALAALVFGGDPPP